MSEVQSRNYLDLLDGVPGGLISGALEVLDVGRAPAPNGHAIGIKLRKPSTGEVVTTLSDNLDFEAWYQTLPNTVFEHGRYAPNENLWVYIERGYSGDVPLSVETLLRDDEALSHVDVWLREEQRRSYARSSESQATIKRQILADMVIPARYGAPIVLYRVRNDLDKYLGSE